MKKYFLVKVKIEKTLEEGRVAKMSEQYLVDALSFTEAEARITEEMKPFLNGEFEVKNINPQKYSELIKSNSGDKWFKAKINLISLDEEKGVEKKTPILMLVQASEINDARENVVTRMKGTMADYEIESISETKIIEVFMYE